GKDEWTVRFTSGFASMVGGVNANSSAYNFNMTATGDNQNLWNIFYKTVNGANAAIEAISALPESAFKDAGRKNEMLGEAYGIRAFAHMYTLFYFGRWWDDPENPYGIIYKTQLSSLSNVYQERETVGKTYELLLADLDKAIEMAPDYTTGKRMSRQMAQAMKAKVLMYRGRGNDYSEALTLVDAILAKANAVGLVLENSLTELYDKAWDSKELLFCRYREKTDDVISAYNYTYGYNYATLTIQTLGDNLLAGDPRYDEAWGPVKSPTTGNNTYVRAPKKLARKGRQEGGDNDKYTTYFMRLTEVYLMRAELLERTGRPLADAMAPINLVRDRSGLGPLTASTKQEFYDHLFKEIFIELHLENEAHWMAAARFTDASGKRLIFNLRPTLTITEDRFIYPLPTSEMKWNPFIDQNPSYEHLVY
ncbi:MAG TPA: RagB/SusD family nutrient uptake outer membrane protein, partial [Parasegetibacter sp.]